MLYPYKPRENLHVGLGLGGKDGLGNARETFVCVVMSCAVDFPA